MLAELKCHHHFSDCCQVTASVGELIIAKETVELRERTWAHLLLAPAELHPVVVDFESRESLAADGECVCPDVCQEEEVMEGFDRLDLVQNCHHLL